MHQCTNQARYQLGKILVSRGLISCAQLKQALQQQAEEQRMLGEILLNQGLISEKQLARSLRKQRFLRIKAAFMAALLGPLCHQVAHADNPASPGNSYEMVDLNNPSSDFQLNQQRAFIGSQSTEGWELQHHKYEYTTVNSNSTNFEVLGLACRTLYRLYNGKKRAGLKATAKPHEFKYNMGRINDTYTLSVQYNFKL